MNTPHETALLAIVIDDLRQGAESFLEHRERFAGNLTPFSLVVSQENWEKLDRTYKIRAIMLYRANAMATNHNLSDDTLNFLCDAIRASFPSVELPTFKKDVQ